MCESKSPVVAGQCALGRPRPLFPYPQKAPPQRPWPPQDPLWHGPVGACDWPAPVVRGPSQEQVQEDSPRARTPGGENDNDKNVFLFIKSLKTLK